MKVKKAVLSLISIFFCYLIVNFSGQIWRLWRSSKKVEEKRTEVALLEKKNQDLRKQEEEIASEWFIEKEAREKLGLGKEGEKMVVLPPFLEQPGGSEKKPIWRQWWDLFVE